MIPILIGGTGRSGTSIVKKVISTHTAVVSIPTELRIIVDPGGALDLWRTLREHWSPYAGDIALQRFEKLLRRAESTNIFKKAAVRLGHRLGVAPISYSDYGVGDFFGRDYYRRRTRQLVQELSFAEHRSIWAGTPSLSVPGRMLDTRWDRQDEVAGVLGSFFRDLYGHCAGGRSVTHLVEDTPYNLLHADELWRLFPDMKFLHVYRDFRDVVASYRVQHWGGRELEALCRRIAMIMECWEEVRQRLPEERVMQVGLEESVAHSAVFQERLLSFTGLAACAVMEKRLVEMNPERLHAGRWRREFSVQEQKTVQDILGPTLERYGYGD